MEPYLHPLLWRNDQPSHYSGILDVESEEGVFDVKGHSTLGFLDVTSIEEFYAKLGKSEQHRMSLGIPAMNYPTFSFNQGYDVARVIALIEQCRKLGYEVRGWFSEESGMTLISTATTDMSEDAGWDLYEWANVHGNCPSDSYGHASWYEFCLFGIPIYDTWSLEDRNGKLVAVSPDDKRLAFFGP